MYGVGFQVPVLWDSTCRDHQAHQDPKVTKVSKGAAKKAVRNRSKSGSQSLESHQHICIGAKALRGRKERLKGGRDEDVGTHTVSAQREFVVSLRKQRYETAVEPHADRCGWA